MTKSIKLSRIKCQQEIGKERKRQNVLQVWHLHSHVSRIWRRISLLYGHSCKLSRTCVLKITRFSRLHCSAVNLLLSVFLFGILYSCWNTIFGSSNYFYFQIKWGWIYDVPFVSNKQHEVIIITAAHDNGQCWKRPKLFILPFENGIDRCDWLVSQYIRGWTHVQS